VITNQKKEKMLTITKISFLNPIKSMKLKQMTK